MSVEYGRLPSKPRVCNRGPNEGLICCCVAFGGYRATHELLPFRQRGRRRCASRTSRPVSRDCLFCVTRERPGEARPDPVTKQGNWIFGHVAPGASEARPGSPSPPIRPLPWGGSRFLARKKGILAENVGWWWVNDKRCSHGTGEWHGRCCVCTMACDWKAGTDSRRAFGMRVAPLWWTNIVPCSPCRSRRRRWRPA